jgi:tRNA threonylcarbamoyladenosine biosynthesis protein TsaB
LKLLALDTSTVACSAALWIDGEHQERFETGEQHSGRILGMIEALLTDAGLTLQVLDGLAFGRGPGSFTGLRIGTGVVQGLAYAADLPVVPVSSLAALAQGAATDRVLAAIDARMNQVYWGVFHRRHGSGVEMAIPERVVAPDAVPALEGHGWIGVGSGWDRYHGILQTHLGDRLQEWHKDRFPRAAQVAELASTELKAGRTVPPEQALPVYLRDEVVDQHRQR